LLFVSYSSVLNNTFVVTLFGIVVALPAKALNAGPVPPKVEPVVNTVPLVVGNVSVVVPDTAGEDNVTLPDVEPLSIRLAII
jgi:hypothetical protein